MKGGDRLWCIRFQTRGNTGRLPDINSVLLITQGCLGVGWGHSAPGHAVHVEARTPVLALRQAFGLTVLEARSWLGLPGTRVESGPG